MDDWEVAFREKSQRRQRRARRNELVTRAIVTVPIILFVALVLWIVDRFSS